MAKWIGLLISLICLSGWIFDVRELTTWCGVVTEKISTVIGFLVLFSCACLATPRKTDYRNMAVCMLTASLMTYLTCVSLSYLAIMSANNWIIAEPPESATMSVQPGIPSIATIAGLMAASATWFITSMRHSAMLFWITGPVVFSVALIALFGHGIIFYDPPGYPILIYYADGVSTAMAIPTAVKFMLLGLAARESALHEEFEAEGIPG